jgi:hypothetical protein
MRCSCLRFAIVFIASLLSAEARAGSGLSQAAWDELIDRHVELTLEDGTVVQGQLVAADGSRLTLIERDGVVRELQRGEVVGAKRIDAGVRLRSLLSRRDAEAEEGAEGPKYLDDEDTPSIRHYELASSSKTVGKGRLLLNALFEPSAYGALDGVDVRSDLLGWLGGPNLAVRADLDRLAGVPLTLEPSLWVGWARNSWGVGLTARSTVFLGNDLLDLGVGLNYRQIFLEFEDVDGDVSWGTIGWAFPMAGLESSLDEGDDSGVLRGWRIPVHVAWFRPLAASSAIEAAMTIEPLNIGRGYGYYGSLRGAWSRAVSQTFSTSIGVTLIAPGTNPRFRDRELDDAAERLQERLDLPRFPVLFAPYLAFRWKL